MEVKDNPRSIPMMRTQRLSSKSKSLTRKMSIDGEDREGATKKTQWDGAGEKTTTSKITKRSRSYSCSRGGKNPQDGWIPSGDISKSKINNLGVKQSQASTVSTGSREKKKKQESKPKINFLEKTESILSMAVSEQEEILRILLSALRELERKPRTNREVSPSTGNAESEEKTPELKEICFKNCCKNLHEIFQAWIHLFHFIFNLRFNVIRVASSTAAEPFTPNANAENTVTMQAIECIKFISKIKLMSVVQSLKEFGSSNNPQLNKSRIAEFENEVLAPFLQDMNCIASKARKSFAVSVRKEEWNVLRDVHEERVEGKQKREDHRQHNNRQIYGDQRGQLKF